MSCKRYTYKLYKLHSILRASQALLPRMTLFRRLHTLENIWIRVIRGSKATATPNDPNPNPTPTPTPNPYPSDPHMPC
jgi:hypothetical protein